MVYWFESGTGLNEIYLKGNCLGDVRVALMERDSGPKSARRRKVGAPRLMVGHGPELRLCRHADGSLRA